MARRSHWSSIRGRGPRQEYYDNCSCTAIIHRGTRPIFALAQMYCLYPRTIIALWPCCTSADVQNTMSPSQIISTYGVRVWRRNGISTGAYRAKSPRKWYSGVVSCVEKTSNSAFNRPSKQRYPSPGTSQPPYGHGRHTFLTFPRAVQGVLGYYCTAVHRTHSVLSVRIRVKVQ